MGWTSKYYRESKHLTFELKHARDVVQELIHGEYSVIGATLEKAKDIYDKNVIYVLVNHPKKYLFVMVILVEIKDEEIYYKEIDETMGPVEDRCPIEFIKALPVTSNNISNNWREKCLKNNVSINKQNIEWLNQNSFY